jgi:hypothetical protein
VKPLLGFLLLMAAGCAGFDEPTSDRLVGLPLRPPIAGASGSPRATVVRFQMSVDSSWLVGEFEGVAVATEGGLARPQVHAQLFGDLGPKVAELLVAPDRIVGYFPQTREGIDCAIPGEAAPHPLLFVGASLAEELLSRETAAEVSGIREDSDGTWLRLRPFLQGTEVHRLLSRGNPELKRRRYWWMFGVHWEEDWVSPTECRISAPHLSMRVKILERREKEAGGPGAERGLSLPEDVRIVAGSRK